MNNDSNFDNKKETKSFWSRLKEWYRSLPAWKKILLIFGIIFFVVVIPIAIWYFLKKGNLEIDNEINSDSAQISEDRIEVDENIMTESRPEISDKTYKQFLSYLGEVKAAEVKELVETGEMSKEEVENWGDKLERLHEQNKDHRDINPNEWRDFEDGWRPDQW